MKHMKQASLLYIFLIFATILAACDSKRNNSETNRDRSAKEASIDSDTLQEGLAQGSGVLKNIAEQEISINTESIMKAALDGDFESIRAAIENGYDVNATDQELHTALMLAAYNGHSEIVKLLLKNEASPDSRDNLQRTALMYASTGPFNESVKLLLEAGADPNLVDSDEHFTAIMFAAAEGQKEVVSTLLKFGADKTLLDEDGESAYDFAIANGHMEVAALLK